VIGVRICKYAELDGEGARRVGGRWNSPGVAAVYMATSLSLAALEVLANLGSVRKLDDYVFVVAEFSKDLVYDYASASLPFDADSRQFMHRIGDRWLGDPANGSMRVHSAVLPKSLGAAPKERIYVFNPILVRTNKVLLRSKLPFRFDRRLIKI